MKANRKSYLLRISEDDWDELNQWAAQEFRSVNGQIELIIKKALDERKKINKSAEASGLDGKHESAR